MSDLDSSAIDRPTNLPRKSLAQEQHGNFRLGLLLIRVGTILAFLMPLIYVLAIYWLPLPNPFGFASGLLAYLFSFFIVLGFVFGIISAIFYKDIVRGKDSRIIHSLILGMVMFIAGSSIAGIFVGIGAYLCYSAREKRRT